MAPLSVFLRNRSSVLFKHRVSSQKVDEITIIANLLFVSEARGVFKGLKTLRKRRYVYKIVKMTSQTLAKQTTFLNTETNDLYSMDGHEQSVSQINGAEFLVQTMEILIFCPKRITRSRAWETCHILHIQESQLVVVKIQLWTSKRSPLGASFNSMSIAARFRS